MLYEFGWIEPVRGAYVGDLRLAVSRDGETFRRVNPHQPVLRRGERGAWDGGFVVTSSDVVVQGEQFWLYYAGASELWTNWPSENQKGAPLGSGNTMTAQTGLATLPLDGFANVESLDREMPGRVTMLPIRTSEQPSKLSLSVGRTLPGRSWIDVEVLGTDGEPLSGYGREECRHVWWDGADVGLRWGDRTVLPRGEEAVRLRFWLHGEAKLYGFSFIAA